VGAFRKHRKSNVTCRRGWLYFKSCAEGELEGRAGYLPSLRGNVELPEIHGIPRARTNDDAIRLSHPHTGTSGAGKPVVPQYPGCARPDWRSTIQRGNPPIKPGLTSILRAVEKNVPAIRRPDWVQYREEIGLNLARLAAFRRHHE